MLRRELVAGSQERAAAGESHLYSFLFRPALQICEALLGTYKPQSEDGQISSEASATGQALIPPRSYSALLRFTAGVLGLKNDSCLPPQTVHSLSPIQVKTGKETEQVKHLAPSFPGYLQAPGNLCMFHSFQNSVTAGDKVSIKGAYRFRLRFQFQTVIGLNNYVLLCIIHKPS